MTEPPQRDVTELVDVAARAMWNEHKAYQTARQLEVPEKDRIRLGEWDDLPPIVKLDWRDNALPVVMALLEHIDGKPIFEIDPTIINDAVPVPDEQCGDYPAPCNCDDPFTHGGHK